MKVKAKVTLVVEAELNDYDIDEIIQEHVFSINPAHGKVLDSKIIQVSPIVDRQD